MQLEKSRMKKDAYLKLKPFFLGFWRGLKILLLYFLVWIVIIFLSGVDPELRQGIALLFHLGGFVLVSFGIYHYRLMRSWIILSLIFFSLCSTLHVCCERIRTNLLVFCCWSPTTKDRRT